MTTRTISNNLTPFTGEEGRKRASEAGKKSAAVRRAKRDNKELAKVRTSNDLNKALTDIKSTFDRGTLADSAASTAQYLMGLIVTGAVEVTGRDMASLIQTLVDVARLEEGQSTSNAVVAHVSSKDAIAHLAALRGEDEGEAKTPRTGNIIEQPRG